jgi:hypothetical protein
MNIYVFPFKAMVIDAPPNSLIDSNASPKMKTTEKGVGVCSFACNTLGVEGCVGALGWGLR